jgi:hypothetical protein
MWSEWMARTLRPRPAETAADTVPAAPLTLPSLTRWALPSPARSEGDSPTRDRTPSPPAGEGRDEGESAPVLVDLPCS